MQQLHCYGDDDGDVRCNVLELLRQITDADRLSVHEDFLRCNNIPANASLHEKYGSKIRNEDRKAIVLQ